MVKGNWKDVIRSVCAALFLCVLNYSEKNTEYNETVLYLFLSLVVVRKQFK